MLKDLICSARESRAGKGWKDKIETRTLHWERETEEPNIPERNRRRKVMSRGTPSGLCPLGFPVSGTDFSSMGADFESVSKMRAVLSQLGQ